MDSWPQLQELRQAAKSNATSCHNRRRHAASSLAACSRAEMTAALLAQRQRGSHLPLRAELDAAVVVLCGAARHASLVELLQGGLRCLATSWLLPAQDLLMIESFLQTVIGPPTVFGPASLPARYFSADLGLPSTFSLGPLLFGEALAGGWPWDLALRLFAGLSSGRSCDGGLGFVPERGKHPTPPPGGGGWLVGRIASAAEPDVVVTVFFNDTGVGFVECTRAVFGSAADVHGPVPAWLVPKHTRWMPDYVRMELDEFGIPVCPAVHVTSLVERRHVWQALIKMDSVTRAIVMGLLCYPRTCWRITPSYLPNHKSWEVDEVKAQLGKKMAAYFFQGAAEMILPGQPMPTVVEPKGAVPKKGKDKFRDISDAREGNKSIPKWGTRLFTVRDLAFALMWRAILFGFDISDGYHISVLAGCTGELVWGWGIVGVRRVYEGDPDFVPPTVVGADGSEQPAPGPHGPQAIFEYGWRLHVGCWPGNCCQTCDKALCGFFFDGCLARWAVAHFGQAPAGSPLNCIALCLLRHAALRGPAAGELRGASSRSLHGVVWVDDFVFYSQVAWHAACAGLAGGCAWCRAALAEAELKDAWWTELCGLLGVPLNVAKHQACAQTVEYSGLLFDSFRGLMLVLPEKLQLLLDHTVELCLVDGRWSPRELDSIHGRMLHYSAAIRHLRILVTEMRCLLGPKDEASYDWPGSAPAGLPELAVEMRAIIVRYGSAGCPLWPPVASSAYAALLCGEEKVLFCSVTWDASTHGWAAVAVWWDASGDEPEKRDLLLVGSWPEAWDVSQQPYREALGGALAFEAFAQQVNLNGRCCILRNDASAAIAAFRKGSTQSAPLQRCALRLSRAAASVDVDCLPLHVPGLTLVAEGVDGASRCGSELGENANVDNIRGPAVLDSLWRIISTAAVDAGWGPVTVDAFASESNARAPRYWSRFFEPGSEALDALCVPDWSRSVCPVCGSTHREVVYAFPPPQFLRPAVEKACADRALCLLVVPVAILAPHWNKLLAASVLPRRAPYLDGFFRVREPSRSVAWSGDADPPAELAVFACDFGRLSPRPALPPLSACPGAFARRQRHLCGSEDDCRVQHRIREALLAQSSGPRPADLGPGGGASRVAVREGSPMEH